MVRTECNQKFMFHLNILGFNTTSVAIKLKLLNIDAHAELLMSGYNGSRLDTLKDLKLVRSKDKEQMVSVVLDTLKNLMAEWCLRSNINTQMGFLLGMNIVKL